MPKGHSYQGTHWTQKPENRERLLAMNRKSGRGVKRGTKRGPYKKKRAKTIIITKADRVIARAMREQRMPQPTKETTIILNGWLVTLGHNSVKIEQS